MEYASALVVSKGIVQTQELDYPHQLKYYVPLFSRNPFLPFLETRLVRHLYFPCIRMNVSKSVAMFIVFFVSAVLHEVLVSVPFHMIRPWSFLGMMMQMPLVVLTKYLVRRNPGSSIGNVIFWLTFCVIGQPMAVLMYTADYQFAKHHADRQIHVPFRG